MRYGDLDNINTNTNNKERSCEAVGLKLTPYYIVGPCSNVYLLRNQGGREYQL